MSDYPPAKHLLRDLHLEVEHGEDGRSRARMPVTDALRTARGTVRLGVLGTLADVIGGGLAALAAAPDWIATSDLTVHLSAPSHADVVHATGRVLRKGASTVVLEVDFAESDGGAPFGIATLGFSILARRDDNPVIDLGNAGRLAIALPDSGFDRHLLDTVGLEVLDAATGAVRLPLAPYVHNSFGALQGGMISLLADVAAEQALGLTPVDLQMTYLALGKVGPITTSARVTSPRSARVEVRDTGADDRLMTIARVSAA